MTRFPDIRSLRPLRRPMLALAVVMAALCPVATSAQDPSAGDLRALRFYYDQGNDEAVQAELRRLQAAHPDWTPPDDIEALFATSVPTEVGRIYDLIASGDFAAARDLISETDAAYPNWSPPSDMLTLLGVSEAQADFDAAVRAGDMAGVIRIARGIPALLSCERINNAWELAEAHLDRGETEDALQVYRGVIGTCSDPDTLVATLEKANAVASLETLAEMSDRAQDRAPGAVETIRSTENRLRVGRGADARWENGERLIAMGDQPDQPEETAEEAAPEATADASEASPTPAPARSAAPAPAPASGGGLSAVQRAAQAGDWSRCLALSANSTQPSVVYQRGWCAYNLDRPLEAITAFETAIRRLGSADQRRDAGYGLLLSMLSLNMTEQAARFAATAPLTRQQRINIEGQILDQRGITAYENGEFARAVAFFRAHAQLTGTTRRDLALLEGYALLNMGDRAGARAIFERLHADLATDETRGALRALN